MLKTSSREERLQPKSICFWPGYARDPDRLAQGAACWRRHPHEAAELVQANDSAIGAELLGKSRSTLRQSVRGRSLAL
jgi:hypothetical protein